MQQAFAAITERRTSEPAPTWDNLVAQSQRLGNTLLQLRARVTTAESCTGGLVAALITEIAGSSQWFDQGVVSYANHVKTGLLGVAANDLIAFGAVSEQVARAMAAGALHSASADLAVGVTGIAGPTGAVPGKPVGTVWFGWSWRQAGAFEREQHGVVATPALCHGDRAQIRRQAAAIALDGLIWLAQAGLVTGQPAWSTR